MHRFTLQIAALVAAIVIPRRTVSAQTPRCSAEPCNSPECTVATMADASQPRFLLLDPRPMRSCRQHCLPGRALGWRRFD